MTFNPSPMGAVFTTGGGGGAGAGAVPEQEAKNRRKPTAGNGRKLVMEWSMMIRVGWMLEMEKPGGIAGLIRMT